MVDLTDILAVNRAQAWQRAKGELRSMLPTFYENPKKFEELAQVLEDFVILIESEGLDE